MIGVDIEEVGRFKGLIRNKAFINRVFTKEEIRYCMSKKNKAQHFAARFAAKEAIWKAISDILSRKKAVLGHKQIGIKNTPRGRPEVVLPPKFSSLKKKVQVSLSHTKNYAVAVASIN